jgi:hypothetical protein
MVTYLNSKACLQKRFSDFLNCLMRICIQSLEKMLRREKKQFLFKNLINFKKPQISNPLKKF